MLILLSSLAWSQPGPQPVSDGATAWATWEQETRPEWERRRATAEAITAARERFFAGETTLAEAFRSLAGARLSSLPVVRGRLEVLMRQASARESQRLEPLPLGEHTEEARKVRDQALDAEDRADELERRLLTRTEAFLVRNPELRDGLLGDRVAVPQIVLPDDPEQRRLVEQQAARADEERAAWRRLQQQGWEAAVRGGPPPDPTEDLALLETDRASEAAERLRRGLGVYADPAAVSAALAAWANGAARAEAEAELEAAKAYQVDPSLERPQLEVAIEAAQSALSTLQKENETVVDGDLRASFLPLRVEAAQLRLGALKARLTEVIEAQDEERMATVAAAKARAEAQAAEATAVDDDTRERARLLSAAADASERLASLTEQVADRRHASERTREEQIQELAVYQAVVDEAEKSSSLVRIPGLDSKYADLRQRVIELEESDLSRGEGVDAALAEAERIQESVDKDMTLLEKAGDSPAMEEWRRNLDRELQRSEELVRIASQVYTDHLAHIRHLSAQRRTLRPYADSAQQNLDLSTRVREAGLELSILVTSMGTLAKERIDQILTFPWRLLGNGRLMVDLAVATLWLLVLLAGWSWARGKSELLAARLGMQLRRFRSDLRPLDLHKLKGPLSTAIRAGIDLCLGYLMVGRISELSGEIAFLVQCWLLLAIYRFLLALFDLGVVRSPQFRPSLVALAPEAFDMVRFSARIAFVWGITRGFVYYLCWTVFRMDAVTTLLGLVIDLCGLLLLVAIAHRWYPMLVDRIRARNQESRLVALLSRQAPRLLQAPVALLLLLFFAATVVSDLWHFAVANDRTGLTQLFNVVSRYQMDEATSIQGPSQELCDALCGTEAGASVHVSREDLNSTLTGAFNDWKSGKRRGLIALVGDRGSGKRTEIDRFLSRSAGEEIPVKRRRLRDEVLTSRALFDEVAELAGVEGIDDPEVMIERLKAIDRSILVIEQAHRTFTRSVGGFEAIQDLLYVMNATSDQHLWLVSFHGPAWAYLSSIPTVVDCGVFRTVGKLEPFTAPMLRDLCQNRAAAAGQQLDYSSLMRNNLLGADPKVELERATSTFYRLLAESSEGNPRVALHLFAACLEQVDEHRCRVHTTKALSTDVVTDLGVEALFILVAVRQQDAMYLPEIHEVTNLPLHTVRNLIRDLQGRGLIGEISEQLYIPIVQLPRVTRTLRRRHLMHLGT